MQERPRGLGTFRPFPERPPDPMSPEDRVDSCPSALSRTADLLEEARRGNAAARETLFSHYREPLSRFLHARIPPGARGMIETDDVVQEVSTRAFLNLDRFEYRGIGSFWGFLRRIGLHYVIQVGRRAGNAPVDTSLDAVPEPAGRSSTPPLSALIEKENWQAFEKALSSVSEENRAAFLLRFEVDLDYATIASDCGFPSADAARMAICRVVQHLTRELARGGIGT